MKAKPLKKNDSALDNLYVNQVPVGANGQVRYHDTVALRRDGAEAGVTR